MNVNVIEKEILKAVDIEKQILKNNFRKWETIEESFTDLQNFIQKLFIEYRGQGKWTNMLNFMKIWN